MPLAFRTIQPVWLARRPLTEDELSEDVAPIAVCHNILLGAIVQLASLVRHADDIFCDLTEECQRVFEKTESIVSKIHNVERIVKQLDSTEVKIPVGSLKQFSKVTDHHVAKHGFDCDHFTPANRPYCIRVNYSMCELSPSHVLRGVDLYRKDGNSSSHLFRLWPFALKDLQVDLDDINTPKQYASPLTCRKRYKTLKLKERRRTIHGLDDIYHNSEKSSDLQTNKGECLSKSQPSIVVSVDTSGSGFERMASFRQSLSKNSPRRRTVSGVPENLFREIEQFEKDKFILRNGPRKYSLDDLDQKDLDARDEIMQQYLLEIDSAIAEREEQEYADQRETKLLRLIPCRRSRSLPRCLKLITSRGQDEPTLSSMFPKKSQQKHKVEEVKAKQTVDMVSLEKFSSSASLGSLSVEDNRSSRSSKRSSLIGDKIRSLVSGTLRSRPKSLDFDSIEVIEEDIKGNTPSPNRSAGRSSSLSRVSSPSMPEGALSRAASNESQIGPGSYYYFDSNTIPRAQAKKYDFPWDSLPKDWTTSVKLREISKRRKEDRQSSSGNWSQSGYSSNRQSVDSDAKSSMPSASQISFGKDSGRDSPRSTGERDGLDAGYMGDAASTESVSDTKSMSNTDSDDWIRTLAEQAASREDVSSTSAEILASLSRLTKQNIRNLDILVPGRSHFRQKRNELEDDGESSVYSVDQEGFYTSFHSDSGLKKSTNTLLEDEDVDLLMPRVREFKSLQSMPSYSTVESVIFRQNGNNSSGGPSSVSAPNLASLTFSNILLSDISESDIPDLDFHDDDDGAVEYGDSGTLKAKKKLNKQMKTPPIPPPRTTSISHNSSNIQQTSDEGLNNMEDSPTSIETSSESSDQEVIYARLKMKTSISAHTFPSWCAGVISDEDDFQERLNAESSEVEELVSGKDSWLSGTLPRANITSVSKVISEFDHTANSWPRIKRPNPQQIGILKTPEKDKTKPVPGNPKVLNFDPVVNLFDASSPHGVQMPLSRLSSSDEGSCSPGITTFDAHPLNYQLPMTLSHIDPDVNEELALSATETTLPHKETSSKHRPALTSDCGKAPSRPRSMVLCLEELTASSTPVRNHSTSSSGKFCGAYRAQNNSSDMSSIHSSSTPSFDVIGSIDSESTTPFIAHDKSEHMLSSNSTIALSDIDSSSLTYVTMSDSSPSGSSVSLNWDTDNTPNPTPMATPVHKHVTRSLPCTTSNNANSARHTGDSVPFDNAHQLNMPSSLNQALSSPPSSCNKYKEEYNIRQTLASSDNSELLGQEKSPDLTTPGLLSGSEKNTSSDNPPVHAGILGFNLQSSLTKLSASDSNNNSSSDPDMAVPRHHQPRNSHYISTSGSRGCRNPNVKEPKYCSSSSSVSGLEDCSKFSGNTNRESISNNQSGSDLCSPADSGYGSPSVSSHPSSSTHTFSYSPSQTNQQFSVVQPQINSSSASRRPSVTLVKQPLYKEQKTIPADLLMKSASVNTSSIARSDCAGKAFKKIPGQSNESHSSPSSASSTHHFIAKTQKTDLSQPLLNRENSNESVNSSSSAGRSDSYRVAMLVDSDEANLIPNKKPNTSNYTGKSNSGNIASKSPGMPRSQLTKSLSIPTPAAYTDDVVSRADSYRCAVRNTQSMLLGEAVGRNSSYRLATCEEDVIITDSRMDACNLWTGKTGASRDVRRMGITDVDQLKHYNNESDNDRSGSRRSTSKIVDTHVKKKLAIKPESEGALNPNKPSVADHKWFLKQSTKDKAKQKTQSSTYIRFDPIFESGEDLRASSESLRPPSIISVRTLAKTDSNETLISESAHLIKQKVSSTSPTRRRSGSHGRREDKIGLSILGSIKTTIRSFSGTKGE